VLSQRTDEGSSFRVLFVCTGNICRSPIAERVARAFTDDALGGDAASLRLESAGTQAVVGNGVHPDSARVLTALGGDPSGFAARQLTDDLAVQADLTLALTRSHRRAALKRAPRGLSRTFTVVEAAELAALVPADVELPGTTFADRCRSLVREMAAARVLRSSDVHDDIADPIGQSPEFHEEVGDAIAHSVLRLFSRFADLSGASRDLERRVDALPAFLLSGR
jgi:protein-tyrosine phosphatase